MPVLLNNSREREHARLYGADAFYDLNLTGRQATMATDLEPGDECVVATPAGDGNIEFAWFSFSEERVLPMPDHLGANVRVGDRMRAELLSKNDAAKTQPYSDFFDRNGNFKRAAVIDAR